MGGWIRGGVGSANLGRPIFAPYFWQNACFEGIWGEILIGKNGAPQICRSNALRIQPPHLKPSDQGKETLEHKQIRGLSRDWVDGKQLFLCFGGHSSGPKKQPKHKVLGRDIPGTSGTQTSGYPGQNFMQVAFFCCFRQGLAGMSRDLGRDVPDLEKL